LCRFEPSAFDSERVHERNGGQINFGDIEWVGEISHEPMSNGLQTKYPAPRLFFSLRQSYVNFAVHAVGGCLSLSRSGICRIHEKKFGEDVSQDVRCRPDYRGGIHRKFLLRHNVALMLIADFVEQYGKVPMLVVLRALGTLVGRGSPAASFIVVVHIEP
jgi:hypothetical protein